MTTMAFIVAVLALAVALAERRHRRRFTEDERSRARDERLAARNGRPHPASIDVVPVNGFDHPEPEELA
jgi:hypothetical protein